MSSYIIQTIPQDNKQILCYVSCGAPQWQPKPRCLPDIFSLAKANKELAELQKQYKGIEVVKL